MGSGVLFFNGKGEILVVKPNYKEGWILPGGTVDENESPLTAAVREVKEEIGLDISKLTLACVDYTPLVGGIKTEALQFVFTGGVLDDKHISQIKLQAEELDTFKFVFPSEALSILTHGLRARLPDCLKAIEKGTVIYRES